MITDMGTILRKAKAEGYGVAAPKCMEPCYGKECF